MEWDELPAAIAVWTEKTAALAEALRRAAVFASVPVGYYWQPASGQLGLYAEKASAADEVLCKEAAARIVGSAHVRPLFLSYQDLTSLDQPWVKVAYAPALRRAGEMLNFFPGQYPGGIPNHPSPLAAMLTSGVVGAGLGWGSGKLLGTMLPAGWGDRLGRTGAIVGGALGSAPGAAWAGTNHLTGRSLNDSSLLAGDPDAEPENFPRGSAGNNQPPEAPQASGLGDQLRDMSMYLRIEPRYKQSADALGDVEFGVRRRNFHATFQKAAEAVFGVSGGHHEPTPIDVDIGALGQTLWETGASPALTASTIGTLYAAGQLPDPRARAGWATGNQLGQLAERTGTTYRDGLFAGLATNAISDYLGGLVGGGVLNAAVGTPYAAKTYGLVNAGLGALGTVISRLLAG